MMMTMRDQVKSIKAISDTELIRRLEKLNIKEREATLSFLLHLNEVDRRRLHLSRGYRSLFDYCVSRFHYSESAANRRIRTARCIRDFPEVYGMLSRGELSLCTVTQISGILKKDNRERILSEVRNRSMREVGMIVSRHSPVSGYRDRVRAVYIKRAIPVTEVKDKGCAVSDAGGEVSAGVGCDSSVPGGAGESGADACPPAAAQDLSGGRPSPGEVESGEKFPAIAGGNDVYTPGDGTSADDSKEIVDLMVLEKKFELRFTVEPGCMEKLERVRSLISNRHPRRLELGRVLDILLDEYLDRNSPEGRIKRRKKRKSNKNQVARGHKKLGAKRKESKAKEAVVKSDREHQSERERSRRIPQRVRDEVFARDGCRCTFVGEDGRCEERDYLQIDHIVPFARGGTNKADNLRLLCAKHNLLEAEKAYGKDHMRQFYRKE